ncbi:MAG: glycosyltransferase family 2 protein [Caulobacter sp.]|nr:glycosyltransferase family 2 protein [Caulobacter sp.]
MTPQDGPPLSITIVMVTYARDEMAQKAINRVREVVGERDDVEFVLVDNNPDERDRGAFIAAFPHRQYVKNKVNKGVSARSDGAAVARGDLIIFLDDDALLERDDSLSIYEASFAADPRLAIVGARHIDHVTGVTPREAFPHTDKSLPQDKPFKTFRFQGNAFAIRKSVYQAVGPLPSEYFYGLEEIDYAYRIVDAGHHILYQPEIRVVEYNDPGGRATKKHVEEMRLTNKLIITYKYMPAIYVPMNMVLFSAYVFMLNKGKINVFKSFGDFVSAVRTRGIARAPIGREAVNYIRECGGTVWR